MSLLVLAHPVCTRQNPESHKTVIVVVVETIFAMYNNNILFKVGTCESAVCVRIESRIESAIGPTIAISILLIQLI